MTQGGGVKGTSLLKSRKRLPSKRGVSPRNRPFPRVLLLALCLAVAIVGAYALSLRGDFLWDDDTHITKNPTIIGPLGLKEIWTSARAYYFPLVLTNFWAQHALWGLEPLGYRLVTLAFHVGSALLLWRVLLSLRVPGAWLGAALWALHPVQVESVAWICELKNTQSAVFFLASMLAWIRWSDRPRSHGREPTPPTANSRRRTKSTRPAASAPGTNTAEGRASYAWALCFALLAILSKPSAVMLPVALGLCTWWLHRRLVWRDVVQLAPFFALSALAASWAIWEQKFNAGAIGEAWSQTLPERFAIAGRAIWFYLGKLVWPDPLIFIYPRWEIDGANLLGYTGIAVFIAAAALLWWGKDGRLRPFFFAGVYFVVLLFPVLGFFSVYFFRYSFVGDHFQYLASMGPLALVGAGLAALPRRLPVIAGGLVVLTLALLTAGHARTFLSNEILWRDTVAKNPAAVMSWFNLGDVLSRSGRHAEAIESIQRGLELKPDDPHALNDLGNEFVLVGRPAEAVSPFERSLTIEPGSASTHSNLGNALSDLGRIDEAITHYRRAVELDPDHAEALNNLGVALAKAGASEESLALFERSLALRPDDAATHDNLGGALRAVGRFDEAIVHHREALRLNPSSAEAQANYGRTLQSAGRTVEALAPLERAVALNPSLTSARTQYAFALADGGRPDAAMAQLQLAVELAPTSADARFNYGSALAASGRLPDAIAQFEAALERAPDFAEAYENLGTALASLQRWPEAITRFETAVRLRPDSLRARTQLAVSLVNSGRLADSVPHFQAALQLQPGSVELHNNFGQVLRALGRTRDAFFHMEEAARLQRER